ncbi:hypothetical protein [Paenibacillus filicis]
MLKQTEAGLSVLLSIAHPEVTPGFVRRGGPLHIRICNVPDGVSEHQVLALYEQTSIFHQNGSSYTVDFSELGAGRVFVNKPLGSFVNSSTAAEIIGITRQAVYAFHNASKKDGYRGKFPRAVQQDPDGGNPWFDREEIQQYAKFRKIHEGRNKKSMPNEEENKD